MTEQTPEQASVEISQLDLKAAESAEQAELNKAQQKHLQNRVVILRVQLNHFQKQCNAALEEVALLKERLAQYEPADEEAPDETPESDPENSPEG